MGHQPHEEDRGVATGTSCQLPVLTNASRPPPSQTSHDKTRKPAATATAKRSVPDRSGLIPGPGRAAVRRCPRPRGRRDRGGLDEVATPPDPPKGHAPPQARQDSSSSHPRASEQLGQRGELGGWLRVNTRPGLRVRQQSLGEAALLAPSRAARAEVRRPVADGHVREPVRARQLPGRPEVAGHGEFGQDAHASSTTRIVLRLGVRSHGLQPRRGAHHECAERFGVVNRRQVDDEHAGPRIDAWRRRTVEHPGEVALDEATKLEAHVPPVQLEAGLRRSRRSSPTRPGVVGAPGRHRAGRWAGVTFLVRPRGRTDRELERGTAGEVTVSAAEHAGGERPEQHEAVPGHTHAGRCRGSVEGLTRIGPPGARVRGHEPSARASAPYSPFGSSTATWRPNTACRSR